MTNFVGKELTTICCTRSRISWRIREYFVLTLWNTTTKTSFCNESHYLQKRNLERSTGLVIFFKIHNFHYQEMLNSQQLPLIARTSLAYMKTPKRTICFTTSAYISMFQMGYSSRRKRRLWHQYQHNLNRSGVRGLISGVPTTLSELMFWAM